MNREGEEGLNVNVLRLTPCNALHIGTLEEFEADIIKHQAELIQRHRH